MYTKRTIPFLYLLIFISVISFAQNSNNILLTTKDTLFIAGQEIILSFENLQKNTPTLSCSGNYGTTLIDPFTKKNNTVSYKIPLSISNKSGILNWTLLAKTQLSGQIQIIPKDKVSTMETYLGPPSIEAGGKDYTMLVVIPTDTLDNPLKEGTAVLMKHQFLSNEVENKITIQNLIAYKNIYSPNKSGRMIISSESLGKNSKEFDVNIMPAIPTNFIISTQRNHTYADGNQITSFTTSIIKDTLGNTVSDGTYVEFFIRNKRNAILKTSGTTIAGIATAKMIHPDQEEQWKIKAYITGMAQSNSINIKYKQVITDFDISFSEKNRTIRVGPFKSFMKQMIPDGLQVVLSVINDNKQIEVIHKTSKKGFVTFILKPGVFKSGTYVFLIETAGIKKKINAKKIW
jgi:hypothetical protein